MIVRNVTVLTVALAALACPSGGPFGACASLSAYCAQTASANQAVCNETLSAAIDSVCENELQTLACGADASAGSCAALAACCIGMSAIDNAECTKTASLNSGSACADALTSF